MGAIADGIMAYGKPLIDQTDGSMEQLNHALKITQLCWNLALLPADEREQLLSEVRPSLNQDEGEFDEFRRSVIDPMIRRHQEMFPLLHQRRAMAASPGFPMPGDPSPGIPTSQPLSNAKAGEGYPGTETYAPCPCGSGKKYKFCCKKKGR
jgi:hypothetical protein